MKTILGILFTITTLTLSAQKTEDFYGKWVYKTIHDKANQDEKSIKMADMMFADMMFNFKADAQYLFSGMGKVEEGKWSYAKNVITTTPDTGKKDEIEVIEIKGDVLVIKLGKAALELVREEPKKP